PAGFVYRFAPVPESFAFHFPWPSVPTHRITTSLPSTEVTKILSPHTTGVQAPMPGILNFQTRFLSTPHSVGRPVSAEWPSFVGPRHWGHSSAVTVAVKRK